MDNEKIEQLGELIKKANNSGADWGAFILAVAEPKTIQGLLDRIRDLEEGYDISRDIAWDAHCKRHEGRERELKAELQKLLLDHMAAEGQLTERVAELETALVEAHALVAVAMTRIGAAQHDKAHTVLSGCLSGLAATLNSSGNK